MNSTPKKNYKKNININDDEKITASNKNIFIKEDKKNSEKKDKKNSEKKNSEKKNSGKKEIKLDSNKYKKNGFERPEITYTDQLSKEEIQDKLADYSKVEDIYKVPLGVHLRYFVKKDGQMLFRMGGQLFKNNGLPEYVILKSGTNAQWSVQIKDTVFYRKMTIIEIKQEYEDIIKKKNEKIQALKEKLKKLEK
jgi:hypothetical protein